MRYQRCTSSLDSLYFRYYTFINVLWAMKKDFIVSKIEALQDGSQYVLVAFTDPNEPKSVGGGGNSYRV